MIETVTIEVSVDGVVVETITAPREFAHRDAYLATVRHEDQGGVIEVDILP